VSAVGSGRDSSITEAERKSDLSLENVKTSIVSRDDEMINVRVQLPGKATQKIFYEALTFLAGDAPPVPGFRKSKGGIGAFLHLFCYFHLTCSSVFSIWRDSRLSCKYTMRAWVHNSHFPTFLYTKTNARPFFFFYTHHAASLLGHFISHFYPYHIPVKTATNSAH